MQLCMSYVSIAHEWVAHELSGFVAPQKEWGRGIGHSGYRTGNVERHIRLLAPLAFVSPRIIAALIDGTAPADLAVTGRARTLPYSWAEQDRLIGPSAP